MDIKIFFLIIIMAALGILSFKIRKHKKWSDFFLILCVLLLAMLAAEFVYRNFIREKQIVSTVNLYYKPDTVVGFHFDPGIITAIENFEGGDTIYDTHYTILPDTNEYGMKYPMRKGYKSDKPGKEAVFLGCSFSFGEGLADEETLAYQFGQLTGMSAANRSCNGMGVHQVYELFKTEYSEQDNHNRIFVYSFFSEHFFRALGLYAWNVAGPYYVISGDTLFNKGPHYKNKKVYGHRFIQIASCLGAFTFIKDNAERIAVKKAKKRIDEEDLAPVFLMIRRMAEMIQSSGGKLILLNWDDAHVNTGSEILDSVIASGKVKEIIKNTGALILPVSDAIDLSNKDYYIPHDGHPSSLANRELAAYLAKHTGQ